MKNILTVLAASLIASIVCTSCFLLPSTTFTLTYDRNGGVGTMEDERFQGNTSITLSANTFTHQNSEFVRWDTKSDGTGVPYTDEQIITPGSADLTLYAQWSVDLVNTGLVYHSFTEDNVIDLQEGVVSQGHFTTIDFVNGTIDFDQSEDATLVQFYQENNPSADFGYLRLLLSDDVKSVDDPNGMLQYISSGVTIYESTNWVGNSGIGQISGIEDDENWGDESHVFIPIAMKLESSAIYYYGYIEVSFDDDPGLFTIHSFAYMNTGSSITAGARP